MDNVSHRMDKFVTDKLPKLTVEKVAQAIRMNESID